MKSLRYESNITSVLRPSLRSSFFHNVAKEHLSAHWSIRAGSARRQDRPPTSNSGNHGFRLELLARRHQPSSTSRLYAHVEATRLTYDNATRITAREWTSWRSSYGDVVHASWRSFVPPAMICNRKQCFCWKWILSILFKDKSHDLQRKIIPIRCRTHHHLRKEPRARFSLIDSPDGKSQYFLKYSWKNLLLQMCCNLRSMS